MQKSWLILPKHLIACINIGLKIGSGEWVLCKAELSCQTALTASFLTLYDLAAEDLGCMDQTICASDEKPGMAA